MFVGWFGIAAGILYSGLIVFAAVTDIRTRRIPNRVVTVLGVLGVIYSVVADPGTPALLRALGGIGAGLVLWLPFYAVGWLGAGDVKLFAAAGAWLGPLRTIEGALYAGALGGLLAIGWMVWRYGARHTVDTFTIATASPKVFSGMASVADQKRTLPYGVVLALGALAAGWLPRTVLLYW